MAANYWASTQRLHWNFTKAELNEMRQALEDEDRIVLQQYPLPDRRLLSIFFNQQLAKLGKRMSVRQQALATAQVYIRRFYTKVDVRNTNVYLILATALYLACKMEESPQYIRMVVSEARNMWPDFIPSDVSKLGECEFYLISEMNSQLIVHHPYRTLQELQGRLNLGQDDISLAWSVINDHYLTDLPLLVAPHVVAIAAIFLSLTLKPNHGGLQAATNAAAALANAAQPSKQLLQTGASSANTPQDRVQYFVQWLAEGEVDIQAVVDSTQELISLYDVWEQYSEKTCKEQVSRFVKARGLDK
ncbi:MAG: hypothetical protein LQ343_003839 [Gyalolechia ehrenbergii]|nr:MAG: hypothetical protein LQ343_003839 [Gyalolechia ehrenbergii]